MAKPRSDEERAQLLATYRARNEQRAAQRAQRERVRENRAATALLKDARNAILIPPARSTDREDAARNAHRAFIAARNAHNAATQRLEHARNALHALDSHGTRNARNAAVRRAFSTGHVDNLNWQELKSLYGKDSRLRYTYGISLAQRDTMYANQHGKCAICLRPFPLEKLHVDHCHTAGHVRQLLCRPCNLLLGHARENPAVLQRAIDYLTRHSPPDEGELNTR